jgi:glycine cleavage system H protein
VNDGLNNDPGLVNRDPFEKGWMVKVKLSTPSEIDRLLSAGDYLERTGH